MSAEPKMVTLPHLVPATAAEVVTHDMSPKEAVALGRLYAQRGHIEAAINDVVNQAAARIGLAIGAKVDVDLGAAAYRVRS